MRIVYMGTPGFAVPPLLRLYGCGHNIAGVFTQPDKPSGRGHKISATPVKALASMNNTAIYQPSSLRSGEAFEILSELAPDLIVVVAYGKLLPREILELPPLGCVNIHGSLLPKYRGSAPIQWAVLRGERETGVTSMFMAEEMDAGDMLLTKKTLIDEDETAGELYNRLSLLGAELLDETIRAIADNKAVAIPQIHEDATFAPPLNKDISQIDWTHSAFEIKCKVRGLNPWPVATAEFLGVVYKIFEVEIAAGKSGVNPGEIVSLGKAGLEVACADGTVIIKQLQAPGGRRMAAADYFRGHPICP